MIVVTGTGTGYSQENHVNGNIECDLTYVRNEIFQSQKDKLLSRKKLNMTD